MTTSDVLNECPKEMGYHRTEEICWFIAQRMTSVFQCVPDVWVVVPEIVLPNKN